MVFITIKIPIPNNNAEFFVMYSIMVAAIVWDMYGCCAWAIERV